MQENKCIGHVLGLFLVGEKGSLGKVEELFLPSDSLACGRAPLSWALAKARASMSKNLQGKDLFRWKLQLRPKGCKGPV